MSFVFATAGSAANTETCLNVFRLLKFLQTLDCRNTTIEGCFYAGRYTHT